MGPGDRPAAKPKGARHRKGKVVDAEGCEKWGTTAQPRTHEQPLTHEASSQIFIAKYATYSFFNNSILF